MLFVYNHMASYSSYWVQQQISETEGPGLDSFNRIAYPCMCIIPEVRVCPRYLGMQKTFSAWMSQHVNSKLMISNLRLTVLRQTDSKRRQWAVNIVYMVLLFSKEEVFCFVSKCGDETSSCSGATSFMGQVAPAPSSQRSQTCQRT